MKPTTLRARGSIFVFGSVTVAAGAALIYAPAGLFVCGVLPFIGLHLLGQPQ